MYSRRHPELAYRALVQDHHPGRHRPDRELRVVGRTELPRDHDVERRLQRARDGQRDRHAAPRYRQDGRGTRHAFGHDLGERGAGLVPVPEHAPDHRIAPRPRPRLAWAASRRTRGGTRWFTRTS